jgi:hypothetical protein
MSFVPLVPLLLCLAAVPAAAAPVAEDRSAWLGKNPFEVWQKEHRWFRLGFRFYGFSPEVVDHAAMKVGGGLAVPLTTDFFMGLGARVAFQASYNHAADCVSQGGVAPNQTRCPEGTPGGVDYQWRQPVSTIDPEHPGRDGNATPGSDFTPPMRRESHVANFQLTIGANYELTIPSVEFFRIVQPFISGGVVLAWVQTYSDVTEEEFVLINNDENDAFDSSNIDPWVEQGPLVGGEIAGGIHINPDPTFRVVFEVGYFNVAVPAAELKKATPGFEAQHMDYRLGSTRFGGGIEFKF